MYTDLWVRMETRDFDSYTDGLQDVSFVGFQNIWACFVMHTSYYVKCWPLGGNIVRFDRDNNMGDGKLVVLIIGY